MNQEREKQYKVIKFNCKDDYEGRVDATLFEQKNKKSQNKAILYVHGFVDYFFQHELADWANRLGYSFYALELRKYGRSILPHQKPNNFINYQEYFEEMDLAVEFIRDRQNNNQLVLMGHSTGGLITSLYTHHRKDKKTIDVLILNSPFFDFNMPSAVKNIALPLVALMGRTFPKLPFPSGLKTGYAESIHKSLSGEWDYDLTYKPIEGFPINLGWINAIYTAQQELQNGLGIQIPILVMHSSKSVVPGNYHPDMHIADSVLDVKDISRYANVLGDDVEVIVVQDGMHDLILSKKKVREMVYNTMEDFLQKTRPTA